MWSCGQFTFSENAFFCCFFNFVWMEEETEFASCFFTVIEEKVILMNLDTGRDFARPMSIYVREVQKWPQDRNLVQVNRVASFH